ncbi:MAG: 2,4-dihydroxyhept-2-ene-1,7-dioic acid aldolase [Clostridia bacterium]
MSTIQETLRGSIVPVVSPFDDENQLDTPVLRRLIDWLISEGSHGVSVGGTTGEPAALSIKERRLLMETAMDQVGGRVPVLLGSGSTNFEETMELTHYAAELGADAALVIVPYYNRPSQEGLFQHFYTVAHSVPDLPIVIYNIPGRTATNMEPATMLRLRKAAPNIVGVKEANRDFEQVSNVLATVGRDFLVYSGIEALCYPMLAVGGAGHVCATGNILPRKVADLYNFVRDGRYQDAINLHYELLAINQALFWETNPAPLKSALGMMGKIRPHLRLPLSPITEQHRQGLEQLLHRYGLLEGVTA